MNRMLRVVVSVSLLAVFAGCATQKAAKTEPAAEKKPVLQYVDTPTGRWLIHDVNRPAPPIITPGATSVNAPSDAAVLFDGTAASLSNWTDTKGAPSKWAINEDDGYMESVKDAGYIQTKDEFGSCQLHV